MLGPTPQKNGKFIGIFDQPSPVKTPITVKHIDLVTPEILKRKQIDFKPRLLFRGLSTLIDELRDIDDEEDEGVNVMNEQERESQEPKDVEVEEEEEVKTKYKKKGLKRTHRRVIMRPTDKSAPKPTSTRKSKPTENFRALKLRSGKSKFKRR